MSDLYAGGENKKGDLVEVEKRDMGTYIEIIKRVTKPDGHVDLYVDKIPKN